MNCKKSWMLPSLNINSSKINAHVINLFADQPKKLAMIFTGPDAPSLGAEAIEAWGKATKDNDLLFEKYFITFIENREVLKDFLPGGEKDKDVFNKLHEMYINKKPKFLKKLYTLACDYYYPNILSQAVNNYDSIDDLYGNIVKYINNENIDLKDRKFVLKTNKDMLMFHWRLRGIDSSDMINPDVLKA